MSRENQRGIAKRKLYASTTFTTSKLILQSANGRTLAHSKRVVMPKGSSHESTYPRGGKPKFGVPGDDAFYSIRGIVVEPRYQPYEPAGQAAPKVERPLAGRRLRLTSVAEISRLHVHRSRISSPRYRCKHSRLQRHPCSPHQSFSLHRCRSYSACARGRPLRLLPKLLSHGPPTPLRSTAQVC